MPDPVKAEEIDEQLKALGDPTRMYQSQLPLFPVIYRLEIRFRPDLNLLPHRLGFAPAPAIGPQRPSRRPWFRAASALTASSIACSARTTTAPCCTSSTSCTPTTSGSGRRRTPGLDPGRQRAGGGRPCALVGIWGWFFLRRERQRELAAPASPAADRARRTAGPGERAAPPGSRAQARGGRAAGPGAEVAALRQHRHHGRLLRPQHQEPARPAQRPAPPLPRGRRPLAEPGSACCARSGRRSAP